MSSVSEHCERIKGSINIMFSDTSVPRQTTKECLTEILDECYALIGTIEEDELQERKAQEKDNANE